MTLYGADIYDFTVNDGFNSTNAKNVVTQGGLAFLNAKITEVDSSGNVFTHSRALQMLTTAVNAGLKFPMGFVVPRSGVSAATLMNRAIQALDQHCPWWRDHPTFGFQIDTEKWSYDPVSIEKGIEVAKYIRDTLKLRVIAIYAPDWGYEGNIQKIKAAGFQWWSSEYRGSGDFKSIYTGNGGDGSHPGWRVVNGVTPLINQYSDRGRVPGYSGNLVVSAVRLSESEFRTTINAGAGGGGANPGGGTVHTAPQSEIAVMRYGARPTVKPGDSGGAVGHLQFLLRDRLGYTIDKVSGSPYGPQTEAAMKDFAAKYKRWDGQAQDPNTAGKGIVDSATWRTLERRAAQKISYGGRPVIQNGSEGMWVGYLQAVLRDAGKYRIDDFDGFPFGPQTEAAVRDFQARTGLVVDGKVGEATWREVDKLDLGGQLPPQRQPEAPPNLLKVKDRFLELASSRGLSGVSFCGIAPASTDAYGYHNARIRHENGQTQNGKNDYSIQTALDKEGDPYYFSAIDLCGNATTRTMTARLRDAVNAGDPRVRYLREFYGSLDNQVVFGRTHSSLTGAWSSSSADNSHLTHVHLSFFRKHNNDLTALLGIFEVLLGMAPGTLKLEDEPEPEESPEEPESPAEESPSEESPAEESPAQEESPEEPADPNAEVRELLLELIAVLEQLKENLE